MALPQAITPIADDEGWARILIHGDSGVGKTTLAAGSPNCLMMFNDPDEGRFARTQGTKAQRWVVRDYDDLTEAIEFLKHGTHSFEWAWLDNGSIFQDQGMDQVMEELILAKPHRNKFVPDKPEYLVNQNRLSFLIREMKGLPMNIGIVSHSMVVEDEEGRPIIMPQFQGGRGNFSGKICGMMGVVGHMTVKRVKAKDSEETKEVPHLQTTKTSRIFAKDRYGTLGDMQSPTMEKILAKIGSAPTPKKTSPVGKKTGTRVGKRPPTKRAATTRRTTK